jgi:beta-xylosidase
MAYGSWSGGLFVLELDKTTGKPIYPGKDGTDPVSQNYVDRYFGVHIAGGNHIPGEGGYIRYDKKSDYFFFHKSYGWFGTTGGYNIRLFRSKNVQGPFVDPAGNQAQFSYLDQASYGIKLFGNYQFESQPGYRSAGHNSDL